MTIPAYPTELPGLTTSQMVEVDRAMIEDYGIELRQMMENAGRNLAHLARVRFLNTDPEGKAVVVLAGTGGNGGGALVCARRLSGWGAQVHVLLTKPEKEFSGVPAHQLDVLRRMQLPISRKETALEFRGSDIDLVVDGVIGYSLSGSPRGAAAELIRWANEVDAPILALDVPSGLDATSGAAFEPAIRASATMTLALPKWGLFAPEGEAHVGELYLADISVPPALYSRPPLGLRVGYVFARGDVVRLR